MEDAIALVEAFKQHGIADVPRALAAYQDGAAGMDGVKLQKTAKTSLDVVREQPALHRSSTRCSSAST